MNPKELRAHEFGPSPQTLAPGFDEVRPLIGPCHGRAHDVAEARLGNHTSRTYRALYNEAAGTERALWGKPGRSLRKRPAAAVQLL